MLGFEMSIKFVCCYERFSAAALVGPLLGLISWSTALFL